jgi:hypothetical protein
VVGKPKRVAPRQRHPELDAGLSAHNGDWVRPRMNLARPKRLRKLPYESNQLPSDDQGNRERERLLWRRYDRLVRAIE